MKDFIKKNKLTVVTFAVCVIFVIFVFVIKLTFFPNEAKAIYGDRLDAIKNNKISKDELSDIENKLQDRKFVKEVNCDLRGRILNVVILIDDETSLDDAKSLTKDIMDNLDKEKKSLYDIQVFISKNNDDEKFPIIGYKQQNKEEFSFTKDR